MLIVMICLLHMGTGNEICVSEVVLTSELTGFCLNGAIEASKENEYRMTKCIVTQVLG